jgi:hypothetical protein
MNKKIRKKATKKHKPPQQPKFFMYSQNNSGGNFIVNDEVTHFMIFEAHSPEEADVLAEKHGVYFDGCDSGIDCSCCGDRWSRSWDGGEDKPNLYGKPIEEYDGPFLPTDKPFCRVSYLDGSVDEYFVPTGV